MEEKNTAEVIEGVKRQEPVRKDDARAGNKKRAMVLVTVVLVALVVVSALAAVDYDALFGRVFDQKLPEPEYAEPDYHENIFENREYMQHAFSGMQVFVSEEGGYSINYAFGDSESAEEAFLKAGAHKYGAKALSDYFYTLLQGCNTPGEKGRFHALFSESYRILGKENSAPGAFPAQKIYDLHFECLGEKEAYDGTRCYHWLVSYRVIRNDGTVLNYSSSADGGQARFFVEPMADGSYRIKEIVGVFKVN